MSGAIKTNQIWIKNPLIQSRDHFAGVPDEFEKMYSPQFWYYLETERIEKIVAIRVYPYSNCIVLKVRFKTDKKYTSILLKAPELRILKQLWDDSDISVLKEYLTLSASCFQQWVNRSAQNSNCFDWYTDLVMGEKNE